ncbi:polygalacturonase-like [Diabrotica undecimpunctata]|uniref:polygalacturonase-like n=1 Tax=Diabrotica undecimpunctata TaxID=50387 RepID=UPI003B64156A
MNTYISILVTVFVAAATASPFLNQTNLGDSCTISKWADVSNVVKSCTKIVVQNLAVPAGKTLELDLKSGTSLTFSGTTSFGYGTYWEGPLIVIKGDNIHVAGNSGSKLDGQGAHYWDGKGDKGNKKPKFFKIQATGGSTFKNINLLNCPHQCVSIQNSKQLTISNWNIDVSAGDKNSLGHNTDGFDISGSDTVNFEYCTVQNQDDCVAVNSGKNLHFNHMTCSGGHGLSLSIGMSKTDSSKNYAQNITFENSIVKNSRNAIHIKTHTDAATGYIKDVTYSNIQISGITNYGINVQEDYANGGSTGHAGNNIPISGLKMNKITGSMTSNNAMAVYILCGSKGCSNFNWSGVSISGAKKQSSCSFKPNGYSC